jgi:dTDP-4-amino-4,6-dideoxygalactose transaminase
MIDFNKPYLTGKEMHYMYDAVHSGKLSGNGKYTKMCQNFFEDRFNFKKCLLTTSCTDALEMAALLLNIESGDEVIVPSYTFVSTANAFVLRGAKIVFADSRKDHPGIDEDSIESLISRKTKAIVAVHYAGVACDMDKIMELASRYGIFVVEDAAQAIDSYYTGKDGIRRPLGSIGHLAAFSFHETKNIISGEGGMLVINEDKFLKRAEILWEKGTDRAAFFRGEVDKYGWVDVGSSFLPSELISSFLWAQLENIEKIQNRRLNIWNQYFEGLKEFSEITGIQLPHIPKYATNNMHMFYLICHNETQRDLLLTGLKENGILAVFHYQSLHSSVYYREKHDSKVLTYSDYYSERLVRLPFFFELSDEQIVFIVKNIVKIIYAAEE